MSRLLTRLVSANLKKNIKPVLIVFEENSLGKTLHDFLKFCMTFSCFLNWKLISIIGFENVEGTLTNGKLTKINVCNSKKIILKKINLLFILLLVKSASSSILFVHILCVCVCERERKRIKISLGFFIKWHINLCGLY